MYSIPAPEWPEVKRHLEFRLARHQPVTMTRYIAPDPARAALIVIDVQNDFTLADAPARIAGTLEALPAMKMVLDAFRRHRAADLPCHPALPGRRQQCRPVPARR